MTSIYAQHSLDLSLSARDRDRYSKIAKSLTVMLQGKVFLLTLL